MNVDSKKMSLVGRRPEHLDFIGRGGQASLKYAQVANIVKKMDRTQSLQYSKEEFLSEFGKGGIVSMKKALLKNGISKPRVILDGPTVHIWDNGTKG